MKILRQKQKEFNIISDIKHSGIKRTLRKNIGRTRVNVSNRLRKSAENQANKGMQKTYLSNTWYNETPTNTKVLGKLEDFAKNNNIDIVKTPELTGGGSFYSPKQANTFVEFFQNNPTIPEEVKNKLATNSKNRKNTILVPVNPPAAVVAHESGHALNSNRAMSNRPGLSGRISRNTMNEGTLYHNMTPVGERSIPKSLLTILEEGNASRKGLKLLRRSGASREELRDAKRFYKTSLGSYKHVSRANTLARASRRIALPGGTSTRHLTQGA